MIDLTVETYQLALDSLEKSDEDLANKVIENEKVIDKLERDYRKSHLKRLNNGSCLGSAGVVFLDMISNLERVGDHSVNIAQAVLGEL